MGHTVTKAPLRPPKLIAGFDDIVARYNPGFRHVGFYFLNYLRECIRPGSRLLDIGCGTGAYGEEYYRRAAVRVGVDPDPDALEQNTLMDEKICGPVERLPEALGEFDVIIAQWVLEHLEDPAAAMRAMAARCRPGGYFIFLTTNIASPLMWLSKILPTSWKKKMKRVLLGVAEEHTHPAPYRMNTVSRIERTLTSVGFARIALRATGVYSYFGFSKALLVAKLWLDRLCWVIPGTDRLATHLVGVYQKK